MTETFTSLKIVGTLLPADVIGKIYAGDPDVPGIGPQTYGLEPGESVRRQASMVWPYLLEKWQEFKGRLDSSPEAASARVTRERWLHILLRELGYGHLSADGGIDLGGKSFPVSHRFGSVPVHLLGWRTDLDHKTPNVTARPPQAMLQELLNRADQYLWAVLSNGSVLRLLRDSTTLAGQSYIEFDLEAIFDGEIFSDFVCLYLICHATRFTPIDGGPASCHMELWRGFAANQGQRALKQLRRGVENAISALGTGFLSHPDNQHLRAQLDPRSAELTLEDFNRSLLRLVYRLLFWFVAEDRGVLLDPDPEEPDNRKAERLRLARHRYETYFSSARLRRLARRRHGDRHGDLWEAVEVVFDALGAEGGAPQIAMPGIGGIFETTSADGRPLPLDEPLSGARLSNEALLGAARSLSIVSAHNGSGRRPVDFGNLGAEELGSVYEGLLEQIPRYDHETRIYTLTTLPGNERKESGTYYTPSSLVDCLLDSALDPLLDEACAKPTRAERIAALLDITVCDPACGSGHFLVAAARRIAKRVAAEVAEEGEPPPAEVRVALRRVVGRCVYGVDINPMAAELAQVSLWIEAMEPGKPLSFLDQNIRVGNSLLGVTPALLAEGLPNAAFKPLEGDDRKVTSMLRKQNAEEHSGQADLFSPGRMPVSNAAVARRADEIARTLPDKLEDLHVHQQRAAQNLAESPELQRAKLLANAWCAAFVQPKTEETRRTAITEATLEQLAGGTCTLDMMAAEDLIDGLARQYRFFHWHVEFPHIFRVGNGADDIDPNSGWSGGFSCIIGNPPWERVTLKEKEFFAARHLHIASAPNAATRKKLIEMLAVSENEADRALYRDFHDELRRSDGWSHVLRESGRYPLTGRGDINTFSVFAENMRSLISANGHIGCIVPSAIATDNTTKEFFSALLASQQLVSLFEFENEGFFPSIGQGHMNRFCLLTLSGRKRSHASAQFIFQATALAELLNPERRFTLSQNDLSLLNPNTRTSPIFRTKRDAELTKAIYRRVPTLILKSPDRNPWHLQLSAMFHMANDSTLFNSVQELRGMGAVREGNLFRVSNRTWLPLYEAKMIHQYDHRYGDYNLARQRQRSHVLPDVPEQFRCDSAYTPQPYYWIQASAIPAAFREVWRHPWLLVWRRISDARASARTMISSVVPLVGVGDSTSVILSSEPPKHIVCLLACLNSFVLDYVTRTKLGGLNLSFYIVEQLPILQPETFDAPAPWLHSASIMHWIMERAFELTFTANDMTPLARDLGDRKTAFVWNEERRFSFVWDRAG